MIAPIAASLIAPRTSALIQPVAFSMINYLIGKKTSRRFFTVISIFFNYERGKRSYKSGKGYDNMNHLHKNFLVLLHPLNNIKIIKYFKYELRFNGVFSRDNLPEKVYIINLDNKKSKENHQVSLFVDKKTAIYFDFILD